MHPAVRPTITVLSEKRIRLLADPRDHGFFVADQSRPGGMQIGTLLAFAGFMLSLIQVALWTGVFVFGGMAVIQSESNANYAGAPVVAAIDQFKEDNDRVPHSIQELVDGGYLPVAWNENFGDMPEDVVEDDVVNGTAVESSRIVPRCADRQFHVAIVVQIAHSCDRLAKIVSGEVVRDKLLSPHGQVDFSG